MRTSHLDGLAGIYQPVVISTQAVGGKLRLATNYSQTGARWLVRQAACASMGPAMRGGGEGKRSDLMHGLLLEPKPAVHEIPPGMLGAVVIWKYEPPYSRIMAT